MNKEIQLKNQEQKSNENKDWRDAFIEAGVIEREQLICKWSANAIQITECKRRTKYLILCAYISQFSSGGFWLIGFDLYFVTSGTGSDSNATYENAKEFINNWSKKIIKYQEKQK